MRGLSTPTPGSHSADPWQPLPHPPPRLPCICPLGSPIYSLETQLVDPACQAQASSRALPLPAPGSALRLHQTARRPSSKPALCPPDALSHPPPGDPAAQPAPAPAHGLLTPRMHRPHSQECGVGTRLQHGVCIQQCPAEPGHSGCQVDGCGGMVISHSSPVTLGTGCHLTFGFPAGWKPLGAGPVSHPPHASVWLQTPVD